MIIPYINCKIPPILLLVSIFVIIIIYLQIPFKLIPSSNQKEGLKSKIQEPKRHIVLLGDSILNNELYVEDGYSIYDLLKKNTQDDGIQIIQKAQDNAKIDDVYYQINELSDSLNNKNTTIFLSVGGNDILAMNGQGSTENKVKDIFIEYSKQVVILCNRFNKSQIKLLNIYQPTDLDYQHYSTSIRQWNEMMIQLKNTTNKGEMRISIINIYKLLKNKNDFVYSIEPSIIGGTKIISVII